VTRLLDQKLSALTTQASATSHSRCHCGICIMSSDAALHSGTFIFYAKNKLHLRAAEDAVSSLSVGTRTA